MEQTVPSPFEQVARVTPKGLAVVHLIRLRSALMDLAGEELREVVEEAREMLGDLDRAA